MRGGTGAAPSDPTVPDPAHSDADLLAAHVAGDPNAFATLVHRHQNRLWATALRMMRNPHDAADALQDAYLAAFRRAEGFRGEAQVTTWLHRIVMNACLDRLRKQQRRLAEQPLPEDPDRLAALVSTGGSEPGGTGLGGTDPLHDDPRHDDLAVALAQLNDDQRAALVLVDVEDYPVEEAARLLGVPAGTVKSRCARGRARLAVALRARPSESTEQTGSAGSTGSTGLAEADAGPTQRRGAR